MNEPEKIRNFCIIAHIDHGKSTLADRFLELTQTLKLKKMQEQVLDQMEIEKERGITVKLAPVRMLWKGFELNLIDTPGHVDFSYEVSRSLAAVEGALLVVDATQGIQAQTVANLHLAQGLKLKVIPVVNKIDLANAELEKTKRELVHLLACEPEQVLFVSAKIGTGVSELLDQVVAQIPAPKADHAKPARSLIFDSSFDEYQGVVAYVRVVDGLVKPNMRLKLVATKQHFAAEEIGFFRPTRVPGEALAAGEIGYIATGLKDASGVRVGDTIAALNVLTPLPGYQEVTPMVFAGLFLSEGSDFAKLREALEKLKLNDASLSFEPERSPALGYGFRIGCLGLLHLDVVQERLRREYGLSLTVTVPSVGYRVATTDGKTSIIRSALDLPDETKIKKIEEPIMGLDIICPTSDLGSIMQFVSARHGQYRTTEYLDETRVLLHYEIPLSSILLDFYDTLKSISAGYASMNYQFERFQETNVVRLDVLIAGEKADALASLVYQDEAYTRARAIVSRLKELLPRQLFEVKIQAALGGKIIAAETLRALRKDVTAKLYGGDVTRKRKLLEKQKRGKQRLKLLGRVKIPPQTYLAILQR